MFAFSNLKSLTDAELWKSFDDHFEMISTLFVNYLKQTNATVITSGDYEPFDIISLMTTDQFAVMLDILFDKLVKISEFGELQVSDLAYSAAQNKRAKPNSLFLFRHLGFLLFRNSTTPFS